MGQSSIIMVVTIAIIFTIVSTNTNDRINNVSNKVITYFSNNAAQNTCTSAAEMLLTKIADDETYRVNSLTSTTLLSATVSYTVADTVIDGDDRIKIRVITYYNNEKAENILIVSIPSNGFIPASVKAVVSTNNNIKTLGSLTIDGRDHDKNGNLIAGGEGTYGVWTTGSLNQSGSSKIGGFESGSNYLPTKPANANVIQTGQVWAGGYPNSPDSIMGGTSMGFPSGFLKTYAQSGSGGNQYVTNPSSLTYPLTGVTYVETSGTWNSANITGSGLLIVHNTSNDAVIKTPSGTFKGLIIADDVDKVHGTIIGGMIVLSPSPGSGNCIGNGNGDILYSKEAIKFASSRAGGSGTSGSVIVGRYRLDVHSWLEI